MDLTPPNGKVIVRLEKIEEKKTEKGIILPGSSITDEELPHDLLRGEVVAAGIECKHIKKGMTILFEQRFSCPFNLTNSEYKMKILEEKDVAGIEGLDSFSVSEQNKEASRTDVCVTGGIDESKKQ